MALQNGTHRVRRTIHSGHLRSLCAQTTLLALATQILEVACDGAPLEVWPSGRRASDSVDCIVVENFNMHLALTVLGLGSSCMVVTHRLLAWRGRLNGLLPLGLRDALDERSASTFVYD